jgi:hypothetical protein
MLLGGGVRSVSEADLTSVCEPTVLTMMQQPRTFTGMALLTLQNPSSRTWGRAWGLLGL